VKSLLLLLLILLFTKYTHAREFYIDYTLNSHYVTKNEIKKVEFKHEFNSIDSYTVTPIIEGLKFHLLQPLGESMFLKFPDNTFAEKCLKFEVQNIYTFEKFATPCKKIWGKNVYSDYINKLNENLIEMIQ